MREGDSTPWKYAFTLWTPNFYLNCIQILFRIQNRDRFGVFQNKICHFASHGVMYQQPEGNDTLLRWCGMKDNYTSSIILRATYEIKYFLNFSRSDAARATQQKLRWV